MGGSAADTPTTPEFLRASDAERDHAVSELRNEFVEGRLSHDTFMYRMQTALDARNRGQLAGLFTDLPPRRSGLLARIRGILRGEDRAGRDERAEYDRDFPGTQRIEGYRNGQRPWTQVSHGPHGPQAQLADPAPFVFPPGSGVRFIIGRNRDCDLCLTDLSVSRRHAQLLRREDGWVLSDLGSHNGTRLNGWLIREPAQIRAGDRVEFGSVVFIIQPESPSRQEPGEPPSEEEPSSS